MIRAMSTPAPIVDWSRVDHVLLDMDGTLLDLAFDNRFWQQWVPERYAEHHDLSLAQARAKLDPEFVRWQGQLQWYCLDHWGELTALDLKAMKIERQHEICALPGAERFLQLAGDSGRHLWLTTNAHRDALDVKLAATGIDRYFEHLISSHDFGRPKEDQAFWQALQKNFPFDPQRALFVDDSISVLHSAARFGIGQVVAISHPDSSGPPRQVSEFPAVERIEYLLEGLHPV